MNAICSRLCMVGHVGQDIHLVNDHQIVITAGGSAYHFANGVRAAGGNLTLLAEVGRCVSNAITPTLQHPRIRLYPLRPTTVEDTSFIYDYRVQGRMDPCAHYSIGAVESDFADRLNECVDSEDHLHVGTMDPSAALRLTKAFADKHPNSSISCNFFMHYLESKMEECIQLGKRCAIVFMNEDEFNFLKASDQSNELFNERIIIVTCGDQGAISFLDNNPVYAASPTSRHNKNSVGAGDVFAGAFLSMIQSSRCLSIALDSAVRIAADSVLEYGSDHLVDADNQGAKGERTPHADRPPIHPELLKKHFVSQVSCEIRGTGLFVFRDNCLMLVKKPNDRAFQPDVCYVPGGKVEDNETAEICARRELLEETSLTSGELVYLGELLFPDTRHAGTLYRFSQFAVIEPIGEAAPADDIVSCWWTPVTELARFPMFSLSKVQMQLIKFLHEQSPWFIAVERSMVQ